jgi:uncharacterized protein YkwD
MSTANHLERYMLHLINQERIANNVQTLYLEQILNESSEDYSAYMLEEGFFSHTGLDGTDPGDRIRASGFRLTGEWVWGENLALRDYAAGDTDFFDEVLERHNALMDSPGHRANILYSDFSMIGIGIEIGGYQYLGYDYPAIMITQHFAHTEALTIPDLGPEIIFGSIQSERLRLTEQDGYI